MPLLAVLFDLDGTLHDKTATLELVARRQFQTFDLDGREIELSSWVQKCVALNSELIPKTEVFSRLAASFRLSVPLQTALLEDFDANLGKLACPYKGALDALTRLKICEMTLGIVTNGRDAFQRSKIEGMGMTKLFDSIVTSGGFGSKKPDLNIFMSSLSELGVQAENAAFVGDSFNADMEPAIALGMHSVWKTTEKSNRVSFCSDDLSQICQHLLSEA